MKIWKIKWKFGTEFVPGDTIPEAVQYFNENNTYHSDYNDTDTPLVVGIEYVGDLLEKIEE